MNLLELYLITVLPNLKAPLVVIPILTMMIYAAACVAMDIEYDKTPKHPGLVFGTCILCFFLSASIPSESQLMMIAGGYIATNTDGVKDLPENLVKAANEFLESYYEGDEKSDGKSTKP
jgi:hypothetical protein